MVRILLFVIGAHLSAVLALIASDVTIKLVPVGGWDGVRQSSSRVVQARRIGTIVPYRDTPATTPVVPVKMSAGGGGRASIVPGSWEFKLLSEDLWAEPLIMDVDQTAAEVSLTAWPATTLDGAVAVQGGGALPTRLAVCFVRRDNPNEQGGPKQIEGVEKCEITDGRWSCQLPVGSLDVALKADGLVSHYAWGIRLSAGRKLGLGKVLMRPGASLVGSVNRIDGRDPTGCRADLYRIGAGPRGESESAVASVSVTNRRGFFQFGPIPAGEYLLVASTKDLVPCSLPVSVQPMAEMQMKEPIVLESGATLDVLVAPSVDPFGGRWKCYVKRRDIPVHQLSVVLRAGMLRNGEISADGRWRCDGLVPGKYRIDLVSSARGSFHSEDIDIPSGMSQVSVEIPFVKVKGEVKYGQEPLSARLFFGGKTGESIEMVSDGSGAFSGYLPRGGAWRVSVESEDPRISRDLRKDVGTGRKAWVEIALPETMLTGTVVDDEGNPIEGAAVAATALGDHFDMSECSTNSRGRFEFAGLPADTVVLTAEGSDESASDNVAVVMKEGEETGPVTLVVRERLTVSGRIIAPSGIGVSGAVVGLFADSTSVSGLAPARSDAWGTFSFDLPRESKIGYLVIFAPGYALKISRIDLQEDLGAIPLDVNGGTLVIKSPKSGPLDEWTVISIYLLHDNAAVSLAYLRKWAAGHDAPGWSAGAITIPDLEPGQYGVCAVRPGDVYILTQGSLPPGPCPGGTLLAGSKLLLTAQE